MPPTNTTHAKDLKLDLKNFRTVPQPDEHSAVKSFITIKPDKFWALLSSLLDDGYIPTENIIVLRDEHGKLIVKEGNRRVGALKLILGKISKDNLNIPPNILQKITNVTPSWKRENSKVPCSIYEMTDYAKVEKIVSLTHAKAEAAGRDPWNSVARARYNRDMSGTPEPALDLLEKYLDNGLNITATQKERWAGDYALTVLDEGVKKILPRLGFARLTDLVTAYPQIAQRTQLEDVMRDIGANVMGFPTIRNASDDVFTRYGIPAPTPAALPAPTLAGSPAQTAATPTPNSANPSGTPASSAPAPSATIPTATGAPQGSSASVPTSVRGATNYPITDQRNVKAL